MVDLRRASNQASILEEAWLVGGRFVVFITEGCHVQAVSRIVHRGDALLSTHRLGHFDLLLSLAVMHNEGLLAYGHVLVRCKRLLALLRMAALWSWFDTLAERWTQIFDA